MLSNLLSSPVAEAKDFAEHKRSADTERYVAEYRLLSGLTYGVFVTAGISSGRIEFMDCRKAATIEGVLSVITHLNRPDMPRWKDSVDDWKNKGRSDRSAELFGDDKIYYYHQPVALVIARSYEKALEAAAVIRITYVCDRQPIHYKEASLPQAGALLIDNYTRGRCGSAHPAFVKVETEYETTPHISNTVERDAALVLWDPLYRAGDLKKVPAVRVAMKNIIQAFRLKADNLSVYSSGSFPDMGLLADLQPHEAGAFLASRKTGCPVLVMGISRNVSTSTGNGVSSIQKIELNANAGGAIHEVVHEATIHSPLPGEHSIQLTDPVKTLYGWRNLQKTHKIFPLALNKHHRLEGAGETAGSFALESALDELAYTLMLDPVILRLINFADKDPENGLPWSSNYLKECYHLGAESFGWSRRKPLPASMRQGEWFVGMGMSSGICCGDDSKSIVSEPFYSYPANYSVKTFCAHFVEVMVHATTGKIKVTRVITAVDAGKVVNLPAAAGKVYNSIVKAHAEVLKIDETDRRHPGDPHSSSSSSFSLHNSLPLIEVIFVNKPDFVVEPTGSKSIGDIGLMGFSAAVANAVYHATGKRARSLPLMVGT